MTLPVVEPTISELRHLLHFSAVAATGSISRIFLIEKVANWINHLEKLTSADEIGLAAEVLTYHGYKNPLGVVSDHVEPMFVISTAHLDENTANRLEQGEQFDLAVYSKAGAGWFVYVGETNFYKAIPVALFNCVMAARAAKCVWLCIDMDATIHDDLPTYAW